MLTTPGLQDAAVLLVDISTHLGARGIQVREVTVSGVSRRAQDGMGFPRALVRVEVAQRDLEAARGALASGLATKRHPVGFDRLLASVGYEADLRGMRLMLWACHGQQDVSRAAAGMVGGAA